MQKNSVRLVNNRWRTTSTYAVVFLPFSVIDVGEIEAEIEIELCCHGFSYFCIGISGGHLLLTQYVPQRHK